MTGLAFYKLAKTSYLLKLRYILFVYCFMHTNAISELESKIEVPLLNFLVELELWSYLSQESASHLLFLVPLSAYVFVKSK